MTRISRRTFVGGSMATLALAGVSAMRGGSGREDAILLNHVGFVPRAQKWCMSGGDESGAFEVIDGRGRRAGAGVWRPAPGDLGRYAIASFSQITSAGDYEVRSAGAGRRRSAPFTVHERVYDDAIRKCIGYFARQRCGDSTTGYHAPCHLDDGVRGDTRARQDVVGGWHDACDVRKWVSATVFGLVGLYRLLEVWGANAADRERIIDEMRWGNEYFLKMQEPDGSLMTYCGGDGGNHFTDNVPGTRDDRRIHVQTAELPELFHFISAQAALIRHTQDSDPAYSRRCDEAARRCLQFCTTRRSARAAASVAAGLIACLELDRSAPGEPLRQLAATFARQLLALQVKPDATLEVHGFFLAKPDEPEPYRDIMHGNLPLLALCLACDQLRGHEERDRWREALRTHCDHLLSMAARSPFGIVPFGLYASGDPGGNRRIGRYWYRWFMPTRGETSTADWWVGINAHLASSGVGLCRAARLLGDERLTGLAQRQFDWIVGVNPFNASTISGVGRHHPPLFVTREFNPPTPHIDGGVMNGIGGTASDAPDLRPGSYHTCEYWTPMVAYTMWLMAELQVG